jgi:hypothetical protein
VTSGRFLDKVRRIRMTCTQDQEVSQQLRAPPGARRSSASLASWPAERAGLSDLGVTCDRCGRSDTSADSVSRRWRLTASPQVASLPLLLLLLLVTSIQTVSGNPAIAPAVAPVSSTTGKSSLDHFSA